MNATTITILDNHCVRTGRVSALPVSIDGQNGVDTLEFIVPESMADWAWRVEIEQNGKKTWRMMEDGHVWTVRAGEVVEGYGKIQAVASRQSGDTTLCWKTREFDICVFPSINASEAVTPGEASALDEIAAQVKSDADRADAAATRAEDAAAGAENIVNTAISDIEAEGQKQAAAVASSGTQALEAIGLVEQTAIAQVQAAGTTQVGAVEDAGDGKLAEIDAANAHAPQINEDTGKWQVWDAQTGAYVDTDTDAQGPQGKTGATGPQGPAGIGVPNATAEDAGKVPVVSGDGSYTLGDPVPEVDTTLTEAGAPADAAAVGAAIEAISPDDGAVDGKPWTSKHIVDMLCPPLEASGNPVQCYPVAGYPLGVKASWGPRQEGTGDPSPENIRPITGLDEVQVVRCGKNLLDFSKIVFSQNDINVGNVSIDYAQRKITIAANINNVGFVQSLRDIVGEVPPGTYVVDAETSSPGAQRVLYLLDTSKAIMFGEPILLHDVDLNSPFSWYNSPINPEENTISNIRFSVHAIDYEPYTGTTATLSLPSTVYGGEVDVETGQGQETWQSYELNSDNMVAGIVDANGNDTSNLFYVEYIDGVMLDNQYSSDTIVCTHLKHGNIVPQTETGNGIFGNPGGNLVYFRLNREIADSTQEFLDWLVAQAAAGTPVTIAYKLATPTSITATGGQQIAALAGVNTVITDGDSVTVMGRADPVATVQTLAERVAALEAETIGGNQA